MKTIIITFCFLLFGVMTMQAQEAYLIYTAEINRIEKEGNNSGRGKALATFFNSRTVEVGNEIAVKETVPYLRQLVDYDFREAFDFFMKVKTLDDAKIIMQNHLSQEERALVRTMASHITSNANKTEAVPYPSNIPQNGYGLKGAWKNNNTAALGTITKTDEGSEEFNKGYAAYQTKNYTEALSWYKQALEKGNVTALFNMGVMYANGEGVTQNYTEAFNWYKKAAEKDYTNALFYIGNMYYSGKGVAQSYTEALSWYKKAAEKGHAQALFNIGVIYYNGHSVAKNETEALIWFQKSADKGHEDAKKTLQQLAAKADNGNEENNKGVAFYNQKNYKEAIVWYEKATEKGNSYAMSNLGYLYFNGLGVEQSDAKAIAYYKQSVEKNNAEANYMMSWITANGFGIPQDTKKAMTYFENAVKLGDKNAVEIKQKSEKGKQQMTDAVTEAQKYIAQKKYLPAIVLLEAAADQGNPDAMYALGQIYNDKNFMEDGFVEAYFWLNQGLRLYHENSITLLYEIYTEHKAVISLMFGGNINDLGFMAEVIGHEYRNETDEDIALRWFKRSADYGSANGATMAGLILYNPKKVKKDLSLAKQYFEKAKKLGDPTADLMLKEIENEMKK